MAYRDPEARRLYMQRWHAAHRRPPNRHGFDSQYARGCRCDKCEAAHALKIERMRAAQKARGGKGYTHGTRAMFTFGHCRCAECVDANRRWWREYQTRPEVKERRAAYEASR